MATPTRTSRVASRWTASPGQRTSQGPSRSSPTPSRAPLPTATPLCGRRLVRRRGLGEPEAGQATAVTRHRSDAVGRVLSPREYLGTPELCEAVGPIKLVGVPGGGHPPPQALQVGVGGDHSDEPPPDSASPVRLQDENVGEVGEGSAVGDHPREAYLLRAPVHAETERVLDRATHDVFWDARGPVGFLEVAVDHAEVQLRGVGAYAVAVLIGGYTGGSSPGW